MKAKHIFFWTITVCLIASGQILFSMGSKADVPPMKPSKIVVNDGEYLKYVNYSGDEIKNRVYSVSKIDLKEKKVRIYMHQTYNQNEPPVPADYHNFNGFIDVSLETGSLAEEAWDITDYAKKNDYKGMIQYHTRIDKGNGLLTYDQTTWNGFEMKKSTSKMKFIKEYPVYSTMAFMWVGMRFLDAKSGGLIFLAEPFAVKDPIPCYVRVLGKETVTTPAGKFNTVKIGFNIADPFLGKLLDSFQKEGVLWFEDSPRSLLIKAKNPMISIVLESISNI